MITVNGTPVLSLVVEKPGRRAWWADLDLDVATSTFRVGDTAIVSSGSHQLRGTVKAVATFGNRTNVTVTGGAGGLGKLVSARHYGPADKLSVARDTLREVGEIMASASSLVRVTNAWSRAEGTAALALDALSPQWRVLDDGTVFVGDETPRDVTPPPVLDMDRDLGIRRVLADDLSLSPHTLIGGIRVGKVRYVVTEKSFNGYWWAA